MEERKLKSCLNCKYANVPDHRLPCVRCMEGTREDYWEPQEEDKE